jgi:hypothetical protein
MGNLVVRDSKLSNEIGSKHIIAEILFVKSVF